MYDAETAQQLEATVAEEKVQVQQCKERVDDLASHLAGGYHVTLSTLLVADMVAMDCGRVNICCLQAMLGFCKQAD